MNLGVVHPGAMGAALAASAAGSVGWASDGRSPATRRRAEAAALVDCGTLASLVDWSDAVISVCPPHAAADVAAAIAGLGFSGIYVDANAIAPALSRTIGAQFEHYVDGGIIGPPPLESGTTRLYLAGRDAPEAAAPFADGPLDVRVLSDEPGDASALKMAYAGWTKGSAALLVAVRAYAKAAGVEDALLAEWGTSLPELRSRSDRSAPALAAKAWRFAGEMEQIAAALAEHGLPGAFHGGAKTVYEALAGLKDAADVDVAAVLDRLLAQLVSSE